MSGTLAIEDGHTYRVVVNHEERYSVCPAGKPPPAGWTYVGIEGSKSHCIDHIIRIAQVLQRSPEKRA